MFPISATVIIAILLLTGCATGSSLKVSPRDVSGAYCAPLYTSPSGAPRVSPVPTLSSESDSSSEADGLSDESRQIAEIIGVMEWVRQMRALEARDAQLSDESKRRLIETRQHLSDRLVMIFFEVSSAVGRVDCEAARANHVASALAEMKEQRVRRYEIVAIVGDALIGVVGGGFALAAKATASGIAEVLGGSFATGFGLAAGLTDVEHQFSHPERTNLLREIWEGPSNSTMYPVSVWRFLNWPLNDEAEYRTRRDELIAEWRNDGLISDTGQLDRRATLFFGAGGTYEVDDLRARAQMHEVIKTTLSVMMQHLYLFSQEVLSQQQVAVK